MELKNVLKNYRKENGLSQREFAKKCDLSNSLISLLEMDINPQTGKKMSSDLQTYRKIAKGMGIPVQSLFEMLDDTELVDLSFSDLESAMDLPEEPKTNEIRILVRDLNKLSPEQVAQAKDMFRMMFRVTNPELFKEDDDNDT